MLNEPWKPRHPIKGWIWYRKQDDTSYKIFRASDEDGLVLEKSYTQRKSKFENLESNEKDKICPEIHRHLGKGSYGSVDEVTYKSKERLARKELLLVPKDSTLMVSFWTEVENLQLLQRLDPTTHTIKLRDAYTIDNERFFLVLDPVARNGNLETYLEEFRGASGEAKKDQRVFLRRAVGCLTVSLYALHEKGLFHGDLNGKNDLLHDGKVLISDFGQAIMAYPDEAEQDLEPDAEFGSSVLGPSVTYGVRSDRERLGAILLDILCALEPIIGEHKRSVKKDEFVNKDFKAKVPVERYVAELAWVIQGLMRNERKHRVPASWAASWISNKLHIQGSQRWMCIECERWMRNRKHGFYDEVIST
ncbi:kinase-like domain-containing protein [Ilyonectria destructans]|nr:kinase-like domain-containing protein [Ilyonectria destructans]